MTSPISTFKGRRIVGYWREPEHWKPYMHGHQDDGSRFPDVWDFMVVPGVAKPWALAEVVARRLDEPFLENGKRRDFSKGEPPDVGSYRGYSECRICGASNGNREFKGNDRLPGWPEGLSHYVREHGLRLDRDDGEEFVLALMGFDFVRGPA